MKRYNGGETVPRGVYLNLSDWELIQLYGDIPALPGNGEVKYIKVPAVLAVLGGPFAGLAFIIFLPLAGIIGIISFLAYKMAWGALILGRKALQPVMISWNPGRAYLTRKGGTAQEKKPVAEPGKEPPGVSNSEIEEEIARRRQQGER